MQPVLQAQDGSFIGTVVVGNDANNNPLSDMVSFDQTGAIRWTVPGNYQPQIATADGGLIATDPSGAAITFDQNGNATGVLPGALVQSWTGNMYRQGSTEQVHSLPVLMALSLWANAGANPSGNSTAARPVVFQTRLAEQLRPVILARLCGFALYPDGTPQYLPNLAIDASSQRGQ